jgi:hypothetical protein
MSASEAKSAQRRQRQEPDMKTPLAFAMTLFALNVSLAQAGEKCSVPMADWKPREDLEARLKAQGWDVRTIKTEDGCYEAYAIDDKGRRVEAYFNPKTFEPVGTADQDGGQG